MAHVLTATLQPSNLPPRIALAVTGAAGTTTYITRTDPDGTVNPVRSAYPATLVAGAWSGYDYESPWDAIGGTNTVTYQAFDTSNFPAVTVGALEVALPWLIHPGVPDLSLPLTLLYNDTPETVATGRAVHDVLNRSTPVVVTDGVRKSPESALLVATATVADRLAFKALLADTATLLLQIPDLVDPLSEWISIGDYSFDKAGGIQGDPFRRWTLPYVVSTAPVGVVAAQFTWADVMGEAATWNIVRSFYLTWNGVVAGAHGT